MQGFGGPAAYFQQSMNKTLATTWTGHTPSHLEANRHVFGLWGGSQSTRREPMHAKGDPRTPLLQGNINTTCNTVQQRYKI